MANPNQVTMITHEQLVRKDHPYRKFLAMIDFRKLCVSIRKHNKNIQEQQGYGIVTLFKALLLQFMEDLSDREMQRFLEENTAAKYFCVFNMEEKTPHFTLFSKVRERIGTHRLAKLFAKVRDSLQKQGYLPQVFTCVDASHLVSKANLWRERDQAIQAKYERLNNVTLPKVAVDPQASIGCKNKNKFWYGFKKHVSIAMQTGLINKVAVTSAHIPDAPGLQHICPSPGAVYGDKGYCVAPASLELARRGCHNATIKRKGMRGKDRDKDRWYSRLRAPYERVFSQQRRRVSYRGIAKNQFSEFLYALCFNLKRLLVLIASGPPLHLQLA